jgi:hypothetical protein
MAPAKRRPLHGQSACAATEHGIPCPTPGDFPTTVDLKWANADVIESVTRQQATQYMPHLMDKDTNHERRKDHSKYIQKHGDRKQHHHNYSSAQELKITNAKHKILLKLRAEALFNLFPIEADTESSTHNIFIVAFFV